MILQTLIVHALPHVSHATTHIVNYVGQLAPAQAAPTPTPTPVGPPPPLNNSAEFNKIKNSIQAGANDLAYLAIPSAGFTLVGLGLGVIFNKEDPDKRKTYIDNFIRVAIGLGIVLLAQSLVNILAGIILLPQ